MKFSKVIGNIDPKLVSKAEEKLSKVFLELGVNYNNGHVGTGIGGDPLIFSLIYPVEHVCTLNMPTAATDGKRYYWNPKFLLKQSLIGLRIICAHEAWHAIYMHPQRRGSRIPKLWNIAVDYIVNGMVMDDFSIRKMNPKKMFKENLGEYMTLKEYAALLKDPFSKDPAISPVVKKSMEASSAPKVSLPAPGEDRDLTEQEKKELERREEKISFYYADPDLEEDMKRPEKIYDFLYNLLPKCSKCGRVGVYSKNKSSKKKSSNQSSDDSEKQDPSSGNDKDGEKDSNESGNESDNNSCGHDHSDGESCGKSSKQDKKSKGGCDECCDGIDIFDIGDTLDEHIDTEESEEKLAKRVADAMEASKRMAGHVPASLEEELGTLTAPKIKWQDIIRTKILKARNGNGKNDWTRFRTRPMFTGLLVPKRRDFHAHFGCLLDTSGSMSKDDIAFGLSQLSSLDERSEGTIVPADAQIYWDKCTKIKRANAEELSKVKIYGRGGTMFGSFTSDYEKNIGKCDFLVIITDGFLIDQDIANMKNPGIDVIWLITSTSTFKPPFGRSFYLRN